MPRGYRTLFLILAAVPMTAFAHPGHGESHDLVHGFMHPFMGLDHVLAMLAVGLIAAQLGGRALWLLPSSFVVFMALAGAAGMAGLVLPAFETGIALSLIAFGLLIAFPAKRPLALMAATVAAFALFHGYAHGQEIGAGFSELAFGVGFVCATALLHLAGIGVGRYLARGPSYLFVRAAGGATAIAGVLFLAGNLIN